MVHMGKREPHDGERKAKSSAGSHMLQEAKATLVEVFEKHLADQEEYETVEEIFEVVEAEVWQEAEKLIKTSFYNGKRLGLTQARRE